MPDPSSAKRKHASFDAAHPLALRLHDRLLAGDSLRVLVVGDGSGRNSRALREAGLEVTAVPDERAYTQLDLPARSFDGALSTHAYLHGTTAKIHQGFAELARVLVAGAPVFCTLGSIHDVRYGFGDQLDANTFAPGTGPEQGVPHAYFDRDGAIDVLRPLEVVRIEQTAVDEIVGKWAHVDEEPPGKVHWFVEARKR